MNRSRLTRALLAIAVVRHLRRVSDLVKIAVI